MTTTGFTDGVWPDPEFGPITHAQHAMIAGHHLNEVVLNLLSAGAHLRQADNPVAVTLVEGLIPFTKVIATMTTNQQEHTS